MLAPPPTSERPLRERLARHPHDPAALRALGLLCFQSNRQTEGLDLVRRATLAAPSDAGLAADHAALLGLVGRLAESADAGRRAVALRPDHAPGHNNLGVTLEKLGRFTDAAAAFAEAARLDPADASYRTHRGNALRKAGQIDAAEAAYREALAVDVDCSAALQALAGVLQEQARHAEAGELFDQALGLWPDNAALGNSILYAIHYRHDVTPRQVFERHLAWTARHETPLRSSISPHANDRSPHRRLRVGYVSPDFRRHSVATFAEPLLANHDHTAFKIVLYSHTDRPDGKTHQLAAMVDGFRDIHKQTDNQAADLIRADAVDLLVDLTGHMGGNRLGIFARKPAPVQVTYVGHPNTTGMAAMDYRLTDPHLDPPGGGSDALHTERLIRLPTTFGCYQPPDPATDADLPVGPPPSDANGFVTFACLNNPAKVTADAIALWCQILHRVPNSKLLLLGEPGVRHIEALFARNGIGPDRAMRVGRFKRRAYLETFDHVDVHLDSFPYNGQTTTCDAAWMGVPTVALAGNSYVSRMGLSLMTNLGLAELAAPAPEAYVDVAAGLALDPGRRGHLRRTMRERMRASPVMDAAALARAIEVAYRRMWSTRCGESAGG